MSSNFFRHFPHGFGLGWQLLLSVKHSFSHSKHVPSVGIIEAGDDGDVVYDEGDEGELFSFHTDCVKHNLQLG